MSAPGLLVRGTGKQQQIAIWIFDDEVPGAPRLLFQDLEKGDSSGLKFKKQELDLVGCSDGHRYGEQLLTIADCRLDQGLFDAPEVEMRCVASHLCVVGWVAITEDERKPNFCWKNSHDLLISATSSCGSAQVIVALDGDEGALLDVAGRLGFRACQLAKPCCLATISCASLSLKFAARISASGIVAKRGKSSRICAATG